MTEQVLTQTHSVNKRIWVIDPYDFTKRPLHSQLLLISTEIISKWSKKAWACAREQRSARADSQEEVLHDVVVVWRAAVGQVTGRENNDGV